MNGLSCRFGTKYGFKSYADLKETASCYNHKIVNIYVSEEKEDVYNGTVDKYHNFFIGKFEETSEFGKHKFLSINNLQCGEIFMEPKNSCRLMHINIASFVNNEGVFNYEKLEDVAYKNMQLCDDLVELELEHVQQISDHIKSTYIADNKDELDLWQDILKVGKESRRCGCGATGISDAIAKMNLKLNSEEGLAVVEKIFQVKMLGEIKA